MPAKLKSVLNHWFPERQFLVRGSGNVSAVRLSQRQQLAFAGAVLAALLWLAGASLGMVLFCGAEAKATLAERTAAAVSARAQAQIARVMAANARLTAQRDQAVAQATARANAAVAAANRARDQAVAQADLSRDEALADATLVAAANSAALDQLVEQTQTTIGQVQTIIRATGLNPDRLAQAPHGAPGLLWSGITNDEATKDDRLLNDVIRLNALGALLNQIPLASPVADVDVTSPFGYRPDPWTGAREFHVGVDLRGNIGTPVYATAPGIVSFAGVATGYGNLVTIEHGYGLQTRYSHLDKILVSAGTTVGAHQEIGLLGNTGWSTGPHLLYETRVDGAPLNPLNFMKADAGDVQK
jgi:murein DD-endopeptidase MepM/ murein hydrolase activator NlpD